MKTTTTFEDGKNVLVERFDGELKIGERNISISDYILSLTEELPINDIVASMLSREEELSDYFEQLSTYDDSFSGFLVQAMEVATRSWLINDPNYLQFVRFALEKIDLTEMEPKSIEVLFTALLKHTKELPENELYTDLLAEMLKRVVKDTQKTEIINKIFPIIMRLAEDVESPFIKYLFDLLVPHIEVKWLLSSVEKRDSDKPTELVGTMIPKNCVFVSATSNTVTYVLEIPKSRMRVKFHDVAYEDVGHPRLLSLVTVKETKVMGMKFFAIQDVGEVSKQTQLFKYPYSNVYETGNVCWSGYSGTIINSKTDIEMLPLMFLSTTNNTHLNSNVRELFESNSGTDFNSEDLARTSFKLKDVLL